MQRSSLKMTAFKHWTILVMTAVVSNRVLRDDCPQRDTGYPGKRISYKKDIKDWVGCGKLCGITDGCSVWVYVTKESTRLRKFRETCYLKDKSVLGNRKLRFGGFGLISGTRGCPEICTAISCKAEENRKCTYYGKCVCTDEYYAAGRECLKRTDDVHVNGEKGEDSAICGNSSLPCRTLVRGAGQIKSGGKIYIEGNHKINKTILIIGGISVYGVGSGGASITRGKEDVYYVFRTSRSIDVAFASLTLLELGLIKTSSGATLLSIVISRCFFYGGPPANPYLNYPPLICWKANSLKITNSYFESFNYNSVITLGPIRSLAIRRSNFSLSDIDFKIGKKGHGEISNTVVYEGSVSVIVDNTVFDYDGNGVGLAIIAISSSVFHSRHGSGYKNVKITFVNGEVLAEISNCLFKKIGLIVDERKDKDFTSTVKSQVTVSRSKITEIHRSADFKSAIHISDANDVRLINVVCTQSSSLWYDFMTCCSTCSGSLYLDNLERALIQNSTFQNNLACTKGGAIIAEGNQFLAIKNSTFVSNHAREGGALYVVRTKVKISACSFIRNTAVAKAGSILAEQGTWAYERPSLTIEDSRFLDSASSSFGGTIVVENCAFKLVNSFLYRSLGKFGGSAIHVEAEARYKLKGSIYNSFILHCQAPSVFMSSSIIDVRNTSITAAEDTLNSHVDLEGNFLIMKSLHAIINYPKIVQSNTIQKIITATASRSMKISGTFNVTCSSNFNVDVKSNHSEGNSSKTFGVSCASCRPNMYTLTNQLYLQNFSRASVQDTQKCLACPSGALCDGYVRALDNYWGMKIRANELILMPCRHGYCCSSKTAPCVDYNTCANGRTGVLCGKCDKEHVQSFIGGGCIPKGKTKCNLVSFLLYFFGTSTMYTVVFAFLPKIVELLTNAVYRLKRKTENEAEDDSDSNGTENDSDSNGIEILKEDIDGPGPIPISAFITLVIFYLQMAALIHVDVLQESSKTEQGHEGRVRRAIETLSGIANFRISIYRDVCPMDNLTLIIKLFIQMALKMSTIINLLGFLLVWKLTTMCRNKNSGPATEMKTLQSVGEPRLTKMDVGRVENTSFDAVTPLSFVSLVKIGFVKLVKVNFTSTASILLLLIHCEKIDRHLHLYIYGDHVCYDWWQYAIMFVLVPTIVLFPLAFGLALDLLRDRMISTNAFILSCAIPFISFWFYTLGKTRKLTPLEFDKEEERCIEEILVLEETLFKSEVQRMRWPVVQLYRNMSVVLINTFLLNHVFKSLWFSTLFVSFFVHDWSRMPFKHPYLNQLQRFTSVCLFLINICSGPASFISSVGARVMSVPNMHICLSILRYAEMFLYILVPLTLPAWSIWKQHQKEKKPSSVHGSLLSIRRASMGSLAFFQQAVKAVHK